MTWLGLGPSMAFATLVSEDATTLGAAALVSTRVLSPPEAIAWVALGIWAGDLGLYTIGRLARHATSVRAWVARRWPRVMADAVGARLTRGAAAAILASRFLPGTRIPIYVGAGLLRVGAGTFAASAAVASMAWTSAIVLGVASVVRLVE